jgi:hypothetical protein
MANKTIQTRIEKNKEQLIEKLKTLPVVQVVCQKIGIGRATYYRWRKEDREFAMKADEALFTGRHFINDMAESQLLSQIKAENMTAIIFWLKHNHPVYGNRLEIIADNQNQGELSLKEAKEVKKALVLGSLLKKPEEKKENEPDKK